MVLCDVKLPDGNGVDAVSKIRELSPATEVVLLTAFGNIPDGVRAMKNGAFNYIVEGDDNDKIIPLLYQASEKAALQKKVAHLEKRIGDTYAFDSIIGNSKHLLKAVDDARKVFAIDATVLLTGETGTGKEVFAQAIHRGSPRASRNFVALNCSTFSEDRLESELFGHVTGAFTGAVKDKKGFIEEANGGTLFLDEIGEMPLSLQAKLLRVLETSEYIRVGDTSVGKSNFRLIAATNRDLKAESENHTFRPDLYFRLNVFEIHIPPLRDRAKDVPLLADIFIERFSKKINRRKLSASTEFLEKLQAYRWPGNIREQKSVIERCVILASGDVLTADVLPAEVSSSVGLSDKAMSAFSMASAEKLQIQKVLNYTQGNKAEAARLAEITKAAIRNGNMGRAKSVWP